MKINLNFVNGQAVLGMVAENQADALVIDMLSNRALGATAETGVPVRAWRPARETDDGPRVAMIEFWLQKGPWGDDAPKADEQGRTVEAIYMQLLGALGTTPDGALTEIARLRDLAGSCA